MAPSLGETVFLQRREYPLAKKAGTRDYVFDFVPSPQDDYGAGARTFFRRHYKDHSVHQVRSLEALIGVLANDVRNAGVTHIREIVIVSHGTPQGLLLNVVNGVTATQYKKYKHLMTKSLLDLQSELAQFPSFNTNRKVAIAKLTDESWVTIRACNFGQSDAGLYALYAFFGGRANVYCPRIYQFFGETPVGPGARFKDRLDVHRHFVMQRFVPGHIHTPERSDAVVRLLADRSGFTAPVEITSVGMDGIVASLDQGLVSDSLKTRLEANDIFLTETKLAQQRPVVVLAEGQQWRIVDVFSHPSATPQRPEKFSIEYQLTRHHITPSVLVVEARPLIDANLEAVPLQLFFTDLQNQEWQDFLGELGGYVEPAPAPPEFQALNSALTAIGTTATVLPPGLLAALGDVFDVDVSPTSTIQRVTAGSPVGPGRLDWLVNNADEKRQYLVKLLHPYTHAGMQAHTLAVHEQFSKQRSSANPAAETPFQARVREKLASLGSNPDQPGTELMSYLDGLPIASLTALIDWLNAPYHPEHAIYLHHAIQSIGRKHDFRQWLLARPEYASVDPNAATLAQLQDPYTNLSLRRIDDLHENSYDFSSAAVWAEVKASHAPPPAFQTDLFTEHPLAFAANELFELDELVADSPGAALGPERAAERATLGLDLPSDKTVYEPTHTDVATNPECEQFAQLIDVFLSMPNKTVDEIDAELRALKLYAGPAVPSLTDLTFYGLPKPIKTLMDIYKVLGPDTSGIATKIVVWVGTKFPEGSLLARAMAAGASAASWRTTGILVSLTRALPYLSLVQLVAAMFHNYISEYANALKRTEQAGKIVAARQWAQALWGMAYRLKENFPDEVDIDLGTDMQELYDREIGYPWRESFNVIFDLDAFRKGFDDGVRLMRSETNHVLYDANKIIDETLLRDGLTPCMISLLWSKGVINPGKARAIVMEQFADIVLEQTPDI